MTGPQLISNVSIDRESKYIIRQHFDSNVREMWTTIPAGLGQIFYAKHDGSQRGQPIYVFLMHSDSWGQYGEQTSDVPKLIDFIPVDYCCPEHCTDAEQFITSMRAQYQTTKNIIKCPVCRQHNDFDSTNYIKTRLQPAIGETCPKCIVCQDHDIELTFNNCGHCVLCIQCATKLAT